jgi:hypothetical protein
MILIYEDEKAWETAEGAASLDATIAAHNELAQSLGPILIAGEGLKTTDTATTLSHSAGRHSVHDGPFAETKEQLGGFYLVDVPDLDAAMGIARRIPMPHGGSVEIRPALGDDESA